MVENPRKVPIGKAGRRNAGIETEGAEAIALSIPLDRIVESIAEVAYVAQLRTTEFPSEAS